MTKTQIFENKCINTPGLKYLDEYLTRNTSIFAGPNATTFEANLPDGSQWRFDTFEQFIAEYPTSIEATYHRSNPGYEVEITNLLDQPDTATIVVVRAPKRETIQKIFNIIEQCLCAYIVRRPPQTDEPNNPPPTPTSKPKKTTSPKTSHRDRKRPCRTTLRP